MHIPSDASPVTLGEILAHRARALIAQRDVHIEWLDLLHPLRQRFAALPAPQRFDRVDHPAARRRTAKAAEPVDDGSADDGASLPADVRDRLRPEFGPAIDAMRVHDDERADHFARRQHADAVTIDRDVYFRAGAYQPHERRGLALVAHEATHVLESMKPNAAWQRSMLASTVEEERRAERRERAVLEPPKRIVTDAPSFDRRPPPPVAAPVPASAPAARPMKAETDRSPATETASSPVAPDALEKMKRALYRDIMDRIRTDFERGA